MLLIQTIPGWEAPTAEAVRHLLAEQGEFNPVPLPRVSQVAVHDVTNEHMWAEAIRDLPTVLKVQIAQ